MGEIMEMLLQLSYTSDVVEYILRWTEEINRDHAKIIQSTLTDIRGVERVKMNRYSAYIDVADQFYSDDYTHFLRYEIWWRCVKALGLRDEDLIVTIPGKTFTQQPFELGI